MFIYFKYYLLLMYPSCSVKGWCTILYQVKIWTQTSHTTSVSLVSLILFNPPKYDPV